MDNNWYEPIPLFFQYMIHQYRCQSSFRFTSVMLRILLRILLFKIIILRRLLFLNISLTATQLPYISGIPNLPSGFTISQPNSSFRIKQHYFMISIPLSILKISSKNSLKRHPFVTFYFTIHSIIIIILVWRIWHRYIFIQISRLLLTEDTNDISCLVYSNFCDKIKYLK